MVYRDFQDMKLSALGMGAMRLPVVNGNDAELITLISTFSTMYAR